MADSGDEIASDVIAQRSEEYLHLKAELAAVSNQVSALRKSFKASEKALVNAMVVNGMEELEVCGVRISRKRELKCES
ncbi:MAG: hypothetical protein K0U52_08300 [Gammaproteobacteria bacterium]|nr:hypothetical protein [Gammaproteobacteria bacterium]